MAARGVGMLLCAVMGASVVAGCTSSSAAITAPLQANAQIGPDEKVTNAPERPRQRRPNLLLITSDDQTDLELRYMPRTRRLLAKNGINFTDAINPHPICCPARAEILTGEYAQNNGVRHNDGKFGGWSAYVRNNRKENLAVWLKRAGYRTAFVGKNLNEYKFGSKRTRGWDFFSPTGDDTYAYYGTSFFNNGSPRRWKGKYVADVVRDETRRLIRTWGRSDRPFFIWASHVGPHDAFAKGRWRSPIPAKRHRSMFGGLKLPTAKKPSFMEKDLSDKPGQIRRWRKPSKAYMTRYFRDRVRSLQAIDEANAATIRALKKAGELKNTLVVYVSDNGFQLGEHGLFGKNFAYAENLQIPMLMSGPGVPRNITSPQPASLVDLAPTFLDYAGVLRRVRQAGHTDGESLRYVASGEQNLNTTSLIQAGTSDRTELRKFGWRWRGVRTGRYTYARWWNGFEEFYDRKLDPFEQLNLANNRTRVPDARPERYTPVVRELKRRYLALAGCRGVQRCERQNFGPEPQP